jgi:hypothetical protein
MSHLDDELRTALRREEPPDGFVNRVLERLPAEPPRSAIARRGAARTWLAAAAALVLATGGAWLVFPGVTRPDVGSVVKPRPTVPADPPAARPQPVQPAPPPKAGDPAPTPPAPPRHAPRPRPRPRDDAEALHAAEQLRTALGVTTDKFRYAQREVREALVVPES